jgi:hypothetical protein
VKRLKTTGLDTFLDSLSRLDVGQLLSIAMVHRGQGSELDVARRRARQQLTDSQKSEQCGRLLRSLVQWSGADGARSGVYTLTSPSRDLVLADARAQAVPGLADAALALLVGSDLDAALRQTLAAAWSSATGQRS